MTILLWVFMSPLGCSFVAAVMRHFIPTRNNAYLWVQDKLHHQCSATKIMVIGILSLPGVGFFGARLS